MFSGLGKSYHICEKASSKNPFVAQEEAACDRINFPPVKSFSGRVASQVM